MKTLIIILTLTIMSCGKNERPTTDYSSTTTKEVQEITQAPPLAVKTNEDAPKNASCEWTDVCARPCRKMNKEGVCVRFYWKIKCDKKCLKVETL